MTPHVPTALLTEASDWTDLHQWERKQLGMALRRLGLTYSEIQAIIPVPKGTLSNWSRDVPLSADQIESIRSRTGPDNQRGIPKDTQWKRRLEIQRIRAEARAYAEANLDDTRFIGGVVLYWGEGAKTRNDLSLSNADPGALRAFIAWVREFLDVDATFVLSMHLHEGNNELAAKNHWAESVGIPGAAFTKTFIKPIGTGHRKNHLEYGVCRVRVRSSSNHLHRTMEWIDVVSRFLGPVPDTYC